MATEDQYNQAVGLGRSFYVKPPDYVVDNRFRRYSTDRSLPRQENLLHIEPILSVESLCEMVLQTTYTHVVIVIVQENYVDVRMLRRMALSESIAISGLYLLLECLQLKLLGQVK